MCISDDILQKYVAIWAGSASVYLSCLPAVYSADRVDADHGLLKANMPQSSLKHSQEVKTHQKPPVLNVDQPHRGTSLRRGAALNVV